MPAHLALPLTVVYLYAWQWIAGDYAKLIRSFNPSLLRSLMVPKIFGGFIFLYYLLKVTAIECIKAYDERMEMK